MAIEITVQLWQSLNINDGVIMLQQTDRLALAVPDAEKSAADLNSIFDSVVIDDEHPQGTGTLRVPLPQGPFF